MITLVTLYIARQAFMNQSEFNYFHVVFGINPYQASTGNNFSNPTQLLMNGTRKGI